MKKTAENKPLLKAKPVAKPRKKKLAAIAAETSEPKETLVPEIDADAPRIECRLVVGDLSVAVDPSSLSHTLGVADYSGGLGMVDSWPDTVWGGLLAHLKLPVVPLDRVAAEASVKRLVQKLWYDAIQGGVPGDQKVAFEKRDAEHAERYKDDFNADGKSGEGVKPGRTFRVAKASKEPKAAKPAKVRAEGATPRASDFTDTQSITVVADKNPYKAGSKAAVTFELFSKSKTVGKFRELAADKAKYEVGYLRYSSRDGYIKLG